ncbi:uncharacterized protein LOC144907292 isoform X6 [Branchiostoma floridae x Branchiostoma belcheri]
MVQPSKTKTMAKTGEGGSSDQQSATEPSSNSVNGDNKKDPIVPGLTKVQLPRSAAKVVLQPKKESETSASYVPKFANVNVKERFEQMRVRKEEKEAKKFEEVRKERESRDQREKHSALRKQFLKELMDSDEEEEEKKPKETPKSYVPKMRGSVRGKFEEMQKQKEEEERRRAEEERKRRIEMDRQIQQQEQESMISKQMEESDSSDAARDVEMFEKMETPTGVPSAAPPVTPSDLPAGERRSIKGKFEEIQKQKEEEARMRAEEERLRRIEMDKLQLEREAARKAEEQEVSESDGDTSSSARFQPTVTDIPTVTRGGVKGKFEAMRKAKEEERLRQMEEERQQRIQAETESLRLSIEAAFSKAEEEDVEEEPEENGLDMSPRLTKKIGSVKGRYEEMQKARDEEHRRQLELERTSRLQMEKQAIENQSETVNVDQVNGINGHSHHQQEEDEKTYTSSETITLRNRPRGDVKGRFENLRKRREEEARRKTQEIRISRIEFDKMMQQREQEKKTSQVEDEEEDGDSASVTSSLTSSFISDADGESGAPQPGTCGSMKSRFEALTTAAKEKPTRTAEPRVRRLKKLDTFVRDTGKDNEEENEVNDTNETTKPRKLDVKNRFEEMRKKREEAERRKTQEIRLGRLELDKIAQEREKERKEKDEVPCDDDNDDSPSEGSPSLDISEPVPSVKDRLHQIKNSTAETQRKAQELQLSRLEFDKMMQEREKERNRKKEEEEDELAGSLEDLSCEPEKPMGSVKGRFEELRKVREEESRRKAEEERLRRLEADRLAQERELEKQAQQESASQANEEEAEDKPEVKEDIPTPKRGSLRGKFEVMQRQKEEEARKKAEEERLRRLEDEKKILAEEAAKREAEYEGGAAEESLAETRETKRERRTPGKLKADYVTLRQRKEVEDRRKAEELRKSRLEFDRAELEREAERLREETEKQAEQPAEEQDEETTKESIQEVTSPKVSLGKLKNKFAELQKKKETSEDDASPREKAKPGKLKNKFEELQKKGSEDQDNDTGAEKAPRPGKLTISFEQMARQKEEEARREAEEERKRKLEEDRQQLEEERARLEAEEAAAAAAASEGGDQEGEEPAESAPEESGPRLSVKERFAMMQKKKEEEEEQRKLKTADVKEAGKNKRASALFEKFQNIDKVAEEERLRKVEEERARRLEMDREMLARELERTEKMVGLEEEAAEEAQEEEEEEPKAAETDEDRAARKQRTRALFSRFENLESYEEQERRRRIEEEKRKRLMLEQREIDEARRKEVGGAADVTGTEELKREEEAREREYMERYARGEASDVDDSEEDESLSATSETLAPKFVKNFENMTIYDGDPVRFEAKVIGRPKPDVTWYLNGKRLPNNQDYRYKFEGDHGVVLELPETFPEDEGEYMCKAVNTSGMALCSALLIIEGKGHRAESSYIKQTVQQPPRSAQPKAAAMKTSGVKQPTGNQPKHSNVQPSMQQPKQKQVGMQPKQGEISPGKSEAVIKEQVVSKSEKITSTTSTGHFVKKSSSTTSEKVVTKTTEVSSSSKPAEKSAASAWELKYGGKPLTAQQLAKQKLAQKMAGKPPSTSVKVPVQKLYVGGKAAPAQTVPPKAPQSQGEPRPTEPQPGAARKQWPPPTKAR